MPEASAADFANAAAIVVQTALKLRSGEHLVVVADAESDAIGQALKRAGEAAMSEVTLTRLDLLRSASSDPLGSRPHKVLPEGLRKPLESAQASCFVANGPHHELPMREQMLHLVASHKIRHVHMPGTTTRAFVHGNRLGYDKVASWGHGVLKRLEFSQRLETSSAAGTKLTVALGPEARWVEHLGEVAPGRSVTFPAGAIYAVPARVDGTFVANAAVGEFFGARAGLLLQTPIRFQIEGGRVTSLSAPQAPDVERDIRAMLAFAPNSERIGLVALGVNVGIGEPTGDASVDQNLPGLHLVIGDPGGRETGAPWTARTSFAACQAGSRVLVEGAIAIDNGKIVSVL